MLQFFNNLMKHLLSATQMISTDQTQCHSQQAVHQCCSISLSQIIFFALHEHLREYNLLGLVAACPQPHRTSWRFYAGAIGTCARTYWSPSAFNSFPAQGAWVDQIWIYSLCPCVCLQIRTLDMLFPCIFC